MIETIKNFIDLFGGKFKLIEIFFWGILFFLICSKIEKRKSRVFFSLLFSIVLLFQLLSLYFTQTFISYRFFIHFNLRSVESIIGIYVLQIFLFSLFFFFVFGLLFKSNRAFSLIQEKVKKVVLVRIQNWHVVVIILISSVILFFRGAAVEDFKALFEVLNVDSKSFKEELKKNNMQDYVTPDDIVSESGKNVIILSLESFERSYLTEDKFKKLTPNLRRLKNEWTYMDMEESYGSDWTSGSLYTFMTGFPAFFSVEGNSIFQTSYHSEVSSIVHIMNKANYSTTFLNANTDFSGVYEMLKVLGIKKIIDKKNFKSDIEESNFGIRDKDLFDIAKKEILKDKVSKKPFAYFISTTDTHFPDGIYDKRMEKYIPKRQSNLEFMINSVDYMVGDFIEFLEENNLLENTIVYIFPDHLKMGDPSIFENINERSLYVLSNSKKIKVKNKGKIFQIDLPNIILDGAEIKHNAHFLADYIELKFQDKKKYIKDNINEITALNTSGYLRYEGEFKVVNEDIPLYNKIKNDTNRFIAHAGGKIEGFTYTNSLEALNLSYEKGFRIFELDIIKTSDNVFVAAHDWDHWKSITGYKGEVPASREVFLKQKIINRFTPLDINGINRWFSEHKDAILVTDKINEPLTFSNLFVDKKRLMMELFDLKAVKEGIKANILSSMPSDRIIREMDEEDLLELKKIGVKHIAISRRLIYLNYEKFLEACLKLGIRPYAFHINADSGIDEEYVLKNEMKYFYGIYADEWHFDN